MLETRLLQQMIELALEDPRCRRPVRIVGEEEVVVASSIRIAGFDTLISAHRMRRSKIVTPDNFARLLAADCAMPAAHASSAVTGTGLPRGSSMRLVAAEAAEHIARASSKGDMAHGERDAYRLSLAVPTKAPFRPRL